MRNDTLQPKIKNQFQDVPERQHRIEVVRVLLKERIVPANLQAWTIKSMSQKIYIKLKL